MPALSRPDTAAWADISVAQLEYLQSLGVVAPDVGDQRKRFSVFEARLAVIAGCAIRMGISPKALPAPLEWLRSAVTFPKIELPTSLVEVMFAQELARLHPLYQDTESNAEARGIWERNLAAQIYFKDFNPDPLSATYGLEMKYLAEALKAAEAENADDPKKSAEARKARERIDGAQRQAKELLSAPLKWNWDGETIKKIDAPLAFELACRDKADYFFHLAAREDSDWSAHLHTDLVRMENQNAWIVIDIRQLFRSRGVIA